MVPEHKAKADIAYTNYTAWAAKQGFKWPLSRPKFTSKLKTKGIICKPASLPGERSPVRCYIGVKIVVEHDGNPQFGEF